MFLNCAKLTSVKVETANDTIKGQLGDAWTYASGAYTAKAPAAPLTIGFILDTYSDGFPTATDEKTAPDGAWKTTDEKSCYLVRQTTNCLETSVVINCGFSLFEGGTRCALMIIAMPGRRKANKAPHNCENL